MAGLVIYLVYLSLRGWVRQYAMIALFAVGSVGFLYSVDYVFNKIMEPHQQIRIKVSLGLEDDPSGAGYNVNESKIAIGSGGFSGKGFLNGTQTKLKYVPEQDRILFSVPMWGEEQGFVGAALVVILFEDLFAADHSGRAATRHVSAYLRVFRGFHLFLPRGY